MPGMERCRQMRLEPVGMKLASDVPGALQRETPALLINGLAFAEQYAAGELRGLKVELLIPERFRLAHIGHRLRFTDDRRTRSMGAGLALCALCKDGSERPVSWGRDLLIWRPVEGPR